MMEQSSSSQSLDSLYHQSPASNQNGMFSPDERACNASDNIILGLQVSVAYLLL
jgi:hypothetical protein